MNILSFLFKRKSHKHKSFLSEKDLAELKSYHSKKNLLPQRKLKIFPVAGNMTSKFKDEIIASDIIHNLEKSLKDEFNFHFMCVRAKVGDGATWIADSIRRDFSENQHLKSTNYNVFIFSQFLSNTSLVMGLESLFSRKTLIREAAKSGLISKPFIFSGWISPIISVLSVILAGIIEHFIKEENVISVNPIGFNGLFFLILLIIFFVIAENIKSRFEQHHVKDDRECIKDLRTLSNFSAHEKNDEINAFIQKMITRLDDLSSPGMIIVDNFGQLDNITKSVIKQYFELKEAYNNNNKGRQIWIIFEHEVPAEFSHHILDYKNEIKFEYSSIWNLQPLEPNQKRELVHELNLSEERLQFTTIQALVHGSDGSKWIRDLLQKARSDKFGADKTDEALQLLKLLAANTEVFNKSYNVADLKESLCTKKERHGILLEYFQLPNFGNIECQRLFDLLFDLSEKTFNGKLLELAEFSSKRNPTFFPSSELYLSFKNNKDEFFSDHLDIAHLYWSFYWYNLLDEEDITQPAWVSKLCFHIANASIPGSDNVSFINKITSRLFDACIFTINQSIKCCLFKNIEALIRKALDCVRDYRGKDRPQMFQRLFVKAYEAFIITADRELVTILATMTKDLHAKASKADVHKLLTIKFETISIDLEQQKNGRGESFLNAMHSLPASMKEHECLVSIWLVGKIDLVSSKFDYNLFHELKNDSLEFFENILKQKSERSNIIDSEESIHIQLLSLQVIFDIVNQNLLNNDFRYLNPDVMLELLERLSSWVDLHKTKLQKKSQTDFFLETILVDFSIALRTFCGIMQNLNESEGDPDSFCQRLVYIAEQLAPMKTSKEFKQKFPDHATRLLKSYYNFSGVIWRQFNVQQRSSLNYLREIVYLTSLSQISHTEGTYNAEQIEIIEDIANQKSFVSVMVNLSLCRYFRNSRDIAGYYLSNAAMLSLQAKHTFYLHLVLPLMALIEFEEPEQVTDALLRHVTLSPVADKISILTSYLKQIREEDLFTHIFELYKSATAATDKSCSTIAIQQIKNVIGKINNPDVRTVTEDYIASNELTTKYQLEKRLEVNEVLQQWHNKVMSTFYPKVLQTLFYCEPANIHLQNELEKIYQIENGADSYSNKIILAADIMNESNSITLRNLIVLALEYLKHNIERWKKFLWASANCAIYRILKQKVPENVSFYQKELTHWLHIKIKSEQLLRIAQMKAGSFFLVFFNYVADAFEWDIKIDLDTDESRNIFYNSTTNERNAQNWLQPKQRHLEPFLWSDESEVISSEFLSVGKGLFSGKLVFNSSYDGIRMEFNKKAELALIDLFNIILDLPNLPHSIAQVIKKHKNYFEHPSEINVAQEA